MGWTIKQTSEKTGIPADTLRYYDKEGILSPQRSENGYRLYDSTDILNLKNLVVMKYAHFSLAEVKTMEALFNSNPSADCSAVSKEILTAKVTKLRQIIYHYQQIVTLMEELLQMIDNADAYQENKDYIDQYINQIFDDIQNGSLSFDT